MHERSTTPSHVSRSPVSSDSRIPLLVCFSHLRWSFVYQRPQHLLSRAAQRYDVVFMEEPIREDVSAPFMKRELTREGVVVHTPILPRSFEEQEANEAQRDMLESLLESEQRGPLIFWYYTPAALPFTSEFTPDVIVYDCMDELSAFKNAPPALRRLETKLFARADVVFTGGHSLYQAKKDRHANIHPFPSSIDARHFGRARTDLPCPRDIAHLAGPRLGFFGVIDERMDLDLVAAMAEARPEWTFIMIGPVVKIDPADLPQHGNIHWIGARDYDVLPDYIGSWDVGLMPFALNESTRFISPTKTPEFLAAGCPVVSTAIADVVTAYGVSGLVEIARSAEDAIACAERLMTNKRSSWLATVDSHLAGNSWDRTWAQMDSLIDACRGDAKRGVDASAMFGDARV